MNYNHSPQCLNVEKLLEGSYPTETNETTVKVTVGFAPSPCGQYFKTEVKEDES